MALATALMLSVLILVLGMSLLTTSQHDLAFQRQQRARDRAEVLARSGLEYTSHLLIDDPSLAALGTGTVNTFNVVNDVEYFTLEVREDAGSKALISEGIIKNSPSGQIQARRTIVVPFGVDNTLLKAEIETQAYYK